ncbi:MAG: electron transfer flavoprotein subunit beta/FixA family protein [Thermomicrobiales bacterium]
MNIVVCVKHVPNPDLPMVVDPETRRLVRDPGESVLDTADEYGVEIALQLAEMHGGEVTVVTMGPEAADDALRRALAMGAHNAMHIVDESLAGSDALGTARTLAAAVEPLDADLVICATESTDAYSGMVPGALAEMLGLPQLTFAREAEVDGDSITVKRAVDTGVQTIQATLPVVMTVTASIAEPRYPTFRGLMQAKRKPVDVKSLADLGLDASLVGEAGAQERVTEIATETVEKEGVKIHDDGGDSIDQIVAYLKRIEVI